jgi:hypothetical protein
MSRAGRRVVDTGEEVVPVDSTTVCVCSLLVPPHMRDLVLALRHAHRLACRWAHSKPELVVLLRETFCLALGLLQFRYDHGGWYAEGEDMLPSEVDALRLIRQRVICAMAILEALHPPARRLVGETLKGGPRRCHCCCCD